VNGLLGAKMVIVKYISNAENFVKGYVGNPLSTAIIAAAIAVGSLLTPGCTDEDPADDLVHEECFENLEVRRGCDEDEECGSRKHCSRSRCYYNRCEDREGYYKVEDRCCTDGTEGSIVCIENSHPIHSPYPLDLSWNKDKGLACLDKKIKIYYYDIENVDLQPIVPMSGICPVSIIERESIAWALDFRENSLVTMENYEVVDSVPLPGESPLNLAFAPADTFWYLDGDIGLSRIDMAGKVIDSVRTPDLEMKGMATERAYLWFVGTHDGLSSRILKTSHSGNILNEFNSPADSPVGIAVADSSVWVLDESLRVVIQMTELVSQQAIECYLDSDGDGFGHERTIVSPMKGRCPEGYVKNPFDCDDTNARVHPGMNEVCNGIDDDCNDGVDENLEMNCMYVCPEIGLEIHGKVFCRNGEWTECSANTQCCEYGDIMDRVYCDDNLSLLFVIDNSGSMTGSDGNDHSGMRYNGLNELVDEMEHGDEASIIPFGDRSEVSCEFTSNPGSLDDCVSRARAASVGGGTNIRGALQRAMSHINSASYRKIIVLLTDGEDSYDADSFRQEAERADITLYAMGFGSADEDVLRATVTEDGDYFKIDNAQQIPSGYKTILHSNKIKSWKECDDRGNWQQRYGVCD